MYNLPPITKLMKIQVAISPSIDCPDVDVGCGTSSRLIKFSGGEGREVSVEVEGPELQLPVGVGPGEWKELPAVEGWEDGGCLCHPLPHLRLLFG